MATFLTDRKEIAKAINLDKLPVITFDLTKPMEGYNDCYEGSKITIEGAHKGRYADLPTHCTPHIWGDELEGVEVLAPWHCKRIALSPRTIGISDSFGLRDVEEMIMWSNTPKVHAEDKVVVFFKTIHPETKKDVGYLRLMKVGKRIDPFCMTATYLVDIEEG